MMWFTKISSGLFGVASGAQKILMLPRIPLSGTSWSKPVYFGIAITWAIKLMADILSLSLRILQFAVRRHDMGTQSFGTCGIIQSIICNWRLGSLSLTEAYPLILFEVEALNKGMAIKREVADKQAFQRACVRFPYAGTHHSIKYFCINYDVMFWESSWKVILILFYM